MYKSSIIVSILALCFCALDLTAGSMLKLRQESEGLLLMLFAIPEIRPANFPQLLRRSQPQFRNQQQLQRSLRQLHLHLKAMNFLH